MMSYPLRFATALAAAIVVSLSSSGVYAVDLFAPNWVIPDNEMPYPSLTASVGDTLTFAWSGGVHDVHIHPSHTCGDPEGSIQIASTDDNPTTYTFLEEDGSLDGTVHTFVCQVGSHCDRGMYMNVTVFSSAVGPGDLVPTDAPMTTLEPSEGGTVETNTTANVTCYVCGNEVDTPVLGSDILELPADGGGFFSVSCQQVFEDGLAGSIPSGDICEFVSTVVQARCGCTPPDYTCNICDPDGELGFVVTVVDAILEVAGQPDRTCGEIDTAAQDRLVTPQECADLASLAEEPCGCAPVGFNCSVCGDNFEVTNPDVEVELLDTTYTCADLEAQGGAGALSPAQCSEAESSIQSACGCAPIGGFANCSICGDGRKSLRPETELTVDGSDATTCRALEQQGYAGLLNPTACAAAQLEAAANCACASSEFTCDICGDGESMATPEANITVSGFEQSLNCGTLEIAGFDGMITPTECTIISPVASIACRCAPVNFTCSICGDGEAPTNLNATFIPGEPLTCGEAQESGMAGDLTPTKCGLYEPLAQLSCGCDDDTDFIDPSTDAPAMPVEAPTLAPSAESPPELNSGSTFARASFLLLVVTTMISLMFV